MHKRIHPGSVAGTARAPPSKSYTHRAILAGGMAEAATVENHLDSADTRASQRAARGFGASIEDRGDKLVIEGCCGDPQIPPDVIDCANSGTTMRLATGIAGLVEGTTVLTGDASLRGRPHGPLLSALTDLGARATSAAGDGTAPLIVEGPIHGGTVEIPGDVSSQFISSLLLAGGLTADGIEIRLTTPLKSAPYVDITIEVLEAFGVAAERTDEGYAVAGGQEFELAGPYDVPGDFSSISYLAAAGAIAGAPAVTVSGVRPGAQGDAAIVEMLSEMGADVAWDREAGTLRVARGPLTGITVDVGDTPDLLPTIAAVGAVADGTTRIENCEHVRLKETDRVAAMAAELDAMGAVVEEREDVLVIHGGESTLTGTAVDGYHDHRIVMALAVAALGATGPTTIHGAEHVDVSFPDFFSVFKKLGVDIETA